MVIQVGYRRRGVGISWYGGRRARHRAPGAGAPRPTPQPARFVDLDTYQQLAARTMGPRTSEQQLANAALGLSGEAGEVADTIKKHLFHSHPLDREAIVKELGDCLWYVAGMATALGVSLAEVGERNIDKLRRRYPDGFSAERSLNRAE